MPTANALWVSKFRAWQTLAQAQSLASSVHPVIVYPVLPISAESNPQSPAERVNVVDIELALDYKSWPRCWMFVNQGYSWWLQILEKAYKVMRKNVSNQKTQKPILLLDCISSGTIKCTYFSNFKFDRSGKYSRDQICLLVRSHLWY